MNVGGFIFDLDGTLLDSMGVWDNIGEDYLRWKGIADIPADLKEILKPMSLLEAAEYFMSRFRIPLSADCIMAEVNGMIEDAYKFRIGLKEGVQEFLERSKGLPMCIATATDGYLAEYALKRLNIDRYFDFILTLAEVGGSKQSPQIYQKAAQRLGLPAENVVVFEDAPHAIRTCKEAGFYTVGVREAAFERDQAEIKRTADCYVKNLNEFEA